MKMHRVIQASVSIVVVAILIFGFIPIQSVQATSLAWSDTNPMQTARSNHTATLLNDGRVLVVGGLGGSGYLSSAELYTPNPDPEVLTGTWAPADPMQTARAKHTATLLTNGKVLVVGGTNGSSALSSAELYDPTTGGWTSAGHMSTNRYFHTATRLATGQVLVAGGIGVGSTVASAELYDPATNTWTTTGPMNTPRNLHTATLLPNGQVLVAGGSTKSVPNLGALNTAELYTPSTGTWQTVTNLMTARRWSHTATLLSNGKVLVIGGGSISTYLNTSELYDTTTGTWSASLSVLSDERFSHTATLLSFVDNSEEVLVSGGSGGPVGVRTTAETYDPSSDTWSGTGPLTHARDNHTATQLFNGQVLVTGGTGNGGVNLASAELYDPTPPDRAPDVPVTISPDGATNTEPSYLWHYSSGATSYHLIVYSNSSASNVVDVIVNTSYCSGGICTYHPSTPLAVGVYKFEVSARNRYPTPSDFSAWRQFTVFGNMTISGNAGTVGVTLTYYDQKFKTVQSGEDGGYSLPVAYNWNGTVTPSKTGYIFEPVNLPYSNLQSNQTDQNYVATAIILTVNLTGNGSGIVISVPAGINCSPTCSSLFDYGTSVKLTATKAPGSNFDGWTGSSCSGIGTCTIVMNGSQSVSAGFSLIPYTLTVSKTGNGTVTSEPAGINCGADCSEIYYYNNNVTLTATPAAGYAFTGWSDSATCPGNGTCALTITADKSITATFALAYNLSVNKTGAGTGTVTSAPGGINCGVNCSAPFAIDSSVTLTAAASPDSKFTGWNYSGCTDTGTCTVTMDSAKSVTANFDLKPFTLFLPLVIR